MPDEPEVICQQMEETRAALADKLETLEQQVVETVSGTTAAVAETVENVKEAVQETVEVVKESVQEGVKSVRDAFDLSRQVAQHPWLFMAGSIGLGYLGGRLLEREARAARPDDQPRQAFSPPGGLRPPQATNGLEEKLLTNGARDAFSAVPERKLERGILDSLASEFSGEIIKVKSLAIGAGLGLVRDLVTQTAPEALKPRLAEVIDSVTVKLGGETMHGQLWHSSCEERTKECHENREQAKMGSPMD